jgi:cytochrome c5
MKFITVLLFLCSFSMHANNDSNKETLLNESVAKVAAEATQQEDTGHTTYDQFCVICHQDGVASAPKFRNETDWKSRLAGRTVDDLVSSATKGLNLMPAQGTCSECTEADLKAAIQYMLPKS